MLVGECDFVAVGSALCECDEWCVEGGYVVEYGLCVEAAEGVVYFVGCESGAACEVAGVEGYVLCE